MGSFVFFTALELNFRFHTKISVMADPIQRQQQPKQPLQQRQQRGRRPPLQQGQRRPRQRHRTQDGLTKRPARRWAEIVGT